MITTVINLQRMGLVDERIGPDYVYVGRPSKWGNPFVIGRHGNRNQVCERYIQAHNTKEFKDMIRAELKNKILGCYCKPKRCHADWLAAVANGEIE